MSLASAQMVQRFDFTQISSNVKRTPQGFLRIPAYLTRTGIFEYVKADGSVVREFRPPEEVFKNDSLITFAGAPITDMHPEKDGQPVLVDPTNAKKLQVGFVGETIKQDGDYMAATLTITDHEMISAIERGDRKEISNGYACAIENTPGEYKGQRYDCIQRNIVGNHVAIGPNDWGRAGPKVALRLDSHGAYLKSIHQTGGSSMEGEKISFQTDGQDTQLSGKNQDTGAPTKAATAERDAKLAELQTKLDAALVELEAEKRARTDAASLVSERAKALAKVMTQATSVLGKDFDFGDMHADAIMKAVVQKVNPKLNLEGRNDAYISGCYDTVMLKADADEPEPKPEDEKEEDDLPLNDAIPEPEAPVEEPKPEAVKTDGLAKANQAAVLSGIGVKQDAKVQMIDWKKNAWKEKLAYSKDAIL